MQKMKVKFLVVLVFFFTLIVTAENGITEKEIILGQSCALSGPAKALGQGLKIGLEVYFAKINAAGGINGHKIKLISKDDGYEPEKAIKNARELINKDKVFILIGEVGTPTSKAILPIIKENKTPLWGPLSGAEILRTPFKKYVINIRASYYQEMEKLAEYLIDKQSLDKIACFYQNDGYGQAGLDGINKALKKRSVKGKNTIKLVATGSYERNTSAVKGGLLKIRRAKPQAVVMVGAYEPCSKFIKLAKKYGLEDSVFCNISFVGTKALLKELGKEGEGCIISQVVNFPWDDSAPIVKEYQEAMKKYAPYKEIGFISLEGYMSAKFLCKTLAELKTINRENLITQVEKTKEFDLGGLSLKFGPEDHQGEDQVFLTNIKNGEIKPLE